MTPTGLVSDLVPIELPPLFPPTQVHALLPAPDGFESWSYEDALHHLDTAEADLRMELPDTDRLAGALETVRIQLEGDRAGSRFPLVWTIGLALTRDGVEGWYADELDALTTELRTISVELERLPVVMAATVMIGDDGFPGVYARVSEHYAPMSPDPYKNLGALMEPVFGAIREMAVRALIRGHSIALVREGFAIEYLWGGKR